MSGKGSLPEGYAEWIQTDGANVDVMTDSLDCILGQAERNESPNGRPDDVAWVDLTDTDSLNKMNEVNLSPPVQHSALSMLHERVTSKLTTASSSGGSSSATYVRRNMESNPLDNIYCANCEVKLEKDKPKNLSDEDIYNFAMGGQNVFVETHVSYLEYI